MPKGKSPCGFCGAQIPTFYKAYHVQHCLRRRLLNHEISLEEYRKRKHLKPEEQLTPKGRSILDPKQRTLWAWQPDPPCTPQVFQARQPGDPLIQEA